MSVLRLPLAFFLLLCAVPCAAQEAKAPAPAQPERSEESVASAPEGEGLAAPATPVASVTSPEAVVPVASEPPAAAIQAPLRWTPPMNEAARAELAAVDARFYELRREIPGLAGPIAMLAVGGAGAAFSGYVAFVAWLLKLDSRDAYVHPNAENERRDRNLMLGLGAGTLVGLGIVACGGVWLGRRLRERREYKPELDVLRHRRRQLLQEVHFGPNVYGNHYGLSLSARF